MTQGEPAGAAGACGGRITRQSALAKGAIRELSCAGSGVATGPSGPCCKRRAQIVGALVVGRQIAAEQRRLRPRLDIGCGRTVCGSAAPGTGRRRHRTTPDCPAGRAHALRPDGRASSAGRAAAPPARTTDRGLRRPSARCTRSWSPTEAPPLVTRISAPASRARRTVGGDVLDLVAGNPEFGRRSAPSRCARAVSAKPLE